MYYLIWYCIISYYIDHIIFYNKSYDTISYYMIKYNIMEFNTTVLWFIIIYIIYINQASLSEIGQVFMRIPEDGDRTLYFGLALCFISKVECTTKVRAIFFTQIKPVFSNSKHLVVSCSSTNKNEIMLCFWSYFYLHDHRYINCLSMNRYEQNLLHLNCYKI